MNDTSPRTTVVSLAESPATKIQRHIESTGAFQVTLGTRGTLCMEFKGESYQDFMALAQTSGAKTMGRNAANGTFYATIGHHYARN